MAASGPQNRTGAGRFVKGQSGNPGGRPAIPAEVRELALAKSADMLRILIALAESEETPAPVRQSSANAVLDRGLGKPAQTLADGDGNPLDWIDILTLARARRMEQGDPPALTH